VDWENEGRHFPVQSESYRTYFSLVPTTIEVTSAMTYITVDLIVLLLNTFGNKRRHIQRELGYIL
jgi:hypothetical protein